MDKATEILSNVVTHMKYAKYKPEEERRETFKEIVDRNVAMHKKKYPDMASDIDWAYDFVYKKKVFPSMRSFQFAGKPIEITPSRVFNCAYLPVDAIEAFSEIMFLLLGGTGVGYSVQKHHVERLPSITKPKSKTAKRFLVGDSIEGWADAIKVLMKSYMGEGSRRRINFDFSDIRQKGALLVTSGGKAPGAQPLIECVMKIKGVLESVEDGEKLTTLQVHDIVCHIADAVLAGGIRRAALISLFSKGDIEMITCKSGQWWESNPQRGRANNSVTLERSTTTKDEFDSIWERVEASGSGEPGIYWTNNLEIGANPCVEIALNPFQFCNLVEVNVSDVENQEDLNHRVIAATVISTLQAGYTDFHYLREEWQEITEKEALIGVSMTGVASKAVLTLDTNMAAEIVKHTNKEVSEKIGINQAARTTCIKPAGTTSLVFGTSSGIHGYHSQFYKRRIRVGKNEAIYSYLAVNNPELIEDEYFSPHDTAVISVPQKAPEDAILRDESPFDLFNRIKHLYNNWVKPGHISGDNTHNISATVSIKDDEWSDAGKWMWDNKDSYNGISVLPFDGGTYKQAPFEEIGEAEYNEMLKSLKDIDLTKVVELTDETDLSGEVACGGGGSCEVK